MGVGVEGDCTVLHTGCVITSLASNPCDASSTPFPGQDKQKCLQILPDWGGAGGGEWEGQHKHRLRILSVSACNSFCMCHCASSSPYIHGFPPCPSIPPVSLLHTPLPQDLTCHQQFQGITGVGPDIWVPASPPVAAVVTAPLGWGHLLQEELRQFRRYIPVNHSSELCRPEDCKPPGGLGCLAPQGDIDPRGHNCSGLSAQPGPGVGGWGD